MDQTNGSLPGIDAASIHPDTGSFFAPADGAGMAGGAGMPETGLPGTTTSGFHPGTLSSDDKDGSQGGTPIAPDASAPPKVGRPSLHSLSSQARSSNGSPGGFTAAQESIEFRILRDDSPVRRLRLTGNRYTFGSAEGCSIRLSDPSLRPMHAVLIRDQGRVLVRAYSIPIEVNGERVAETTLQVGDQLQLGEYRFELLEINVAAPTLTDTHSSAAIGSAAIGSAAIGSAATDRRSSFSAPSMSSPDRSPAASGSNPPQSVDHDDMVWRQRLRREIDQWRSRQVECDERETRCDEREAHLRGRESELWSRAENLYRREAKLQDQESSVYQLHDEYAAKQEELLKLQDQANHKQRLFHQRESEFAKQEVEYQQKLEEATSQLLISQSQAAAATEAVREMRQQFDALNEQIEALSNQQNELKQHEASEREENQRLRGDLESQRDAAIDAQAQSEAFRTEAEARVDEMTQEIEALRSQNENANKQLETQRIELTQASTSEADQLLLEENARTIASLRDKVDQLQDTVDEASEEASRVRIDYREALDSVRQLEGLVAQSNERGDIDRSEWAAEADSLRSEIESLSSDLQRTQNELDELRSANESLTHRLHEVELERDEAIEEINDRPTREAFDHLRNELEDASRTLADLQQGIRSSASTPIAGASAAAAAAATAKFAADIATNVDEIAEKSDGSELTPEEAVSQESVSQEPEAFGLSGNSNWSSVDSSNQAQDDEDDADVWPMYSTPQEPDSRESEFEANDSVDADDSSAMESQNESPEQPADEFSDESNDESNDAPSIWNLQNTAVNSDLEANHERSQLDESATESGPSVDAEPAAGPTGESIESTGIWNHESSEVALADLNADSSVQDPATPEFASTTESGEEDDERVQSQPEGSLASMLISDLANEADDVETEHQSTDSVWDVGEDEGNDSENGNPFADAYADQTGDSLTNHDDDSPESASVGFEYASGDMTAMMPESFGPDSFGPDSFGPDSMDSGAYASDNEDVAGVDMPGVDMPGEDVTDAKDAFASYHQEMLADPVAAPEDMPAAEAPVESPYEPEPIQIPEPEPIQQPEPVQQPEATGNEQEADEESDDSIEAYMNRLLGRVQATPEATSTASTNSEPAASLSVSLSGDSNPPTTDSSIPIVPEIETDPDAPLVPRSKAPERDSNLSAMRDLANQTARSAISRSTRIQTRNMQMAGLLNFGVAVVAVLFGFGASFLLSGGLFYLAWLMVFIIAGISIRDGMRNLSDARARLQAAKKGDDVAQNDYADDARAKAESRLNAERDLAQDLHSHPEAVR
jgi:hypothetical protein